MTSPSSARDRRRFGGVSIIALLIAVAAYSILAEKSIFVPSIVSILMLGLSAITIRMVSVPYCKVFIYLWLVWFLIGLLSYYSAAQVGDSWTKFTTPDVEPYATVYSGFMLVFSLGIFACDYFVVARNHHSTYSIKEDVGIVTGRNIFNLAILTAFPFVYLVSIWKYVGGIPLLSGVAFYDQLYEINYGPLYYFSIIIPVAIIYYVAWFRLIERPGKLLAHFLILGVFFTAAMADGKRFNLIISLCALGMYMQYVANIRSMRNIIIGSLMAGIALYLYILVHQIRTTGTTDMAISLFVLATSIGGEFRDSIYAMDVFPRDAVFGQGYDWLGSTLASMVNRSVLDFLGFSKEALGSNDSARVFMRLFDVQFGIRLGIITEIWFAYGIYGTVVMFLLGVGVHLLARMAFLERDILKKTFLLAALANCLVGVMSQSSVIFGAIPSLVYVYVLCASIRFLGGGTKLRPK